MPRNDGGREGRRRAVTRRDGESGQGLPFVLVTGTVLLVLLVALVDLLWNEMKFLSKTAKRSVMVVAADGAVDRAIYALQKGGGWDAVPKAAVAGYAQDSVYSDQPGVIYTLKVEEGNWTPGIQIGDTKLERTITVFLTHTVTGEKKKVQAVVIQSTLNSAIFSGGQITIGGSADVNWGPVVSYSMASDAIPLGSLPTHPIFMAAGGITIGGTAASLMVPSKDCSDPSAAVCVNEYATPSELGAQPVVPIAEFRSIAIAQNATGKGWYQGGAGTCTWNTAIPATDDTSVCFFDTCDGTNYNPVTDTVCSGCTSTAHGADIKVAGSWCGNGVLVVMGDLDTKGTGCGMSLTMTPPPNCYPKYDTNSGNCAAVNNPTLFWNGFVYVAGSLSSSGNKKVYGTIYAYDSAGITGNFSVWYKTSNSTIGYLGKSVFTKCWLERAPVAGDVFP